FTDLTSGPNTGGENNNGTILTIYGNFFGINGAGCGSTTTVTVGGGAVAAYIGQCPTQWLWYQKISVAIGPNAATGNVVVRVNGVDSNGVPFTVRSGNIRCISPTGNDANSGNFGACWRNATKVKSIAAGDIVYFRAGTWNTEDNFSSVILIQGSNSGTAAAPKAVVGYPGEQVIISQPYALYFQGNGTNRYWTFANITWRGYYTIRNEADTTGLRFIGNTIDDSKSTGLVMYGDFTDHSIYGNKIFNYVSCSNLSGDQCSERGYGIYYAGGDSTVGGSAISSDIKIGWNQIYSTAAYGPGKTSNGSKSIQFYGHAAGDSISNVSIHDNMMFNNCREAMVLGGGDNGGNVFANGGTNYVFNNLIVDNGWCDASFEYMAVLVDGTSTIHFWNNTFWGNAYGNNGGNISSEIERDGGSIRLNNNIFVAPSPLGGHDTYLQGMSSANTSGSNNAFAGQGNGPTFLTNNVNTTSIALALVNPLKGIATADFSLGALSSAKDAGTTT